MSFFTATEEADLEEEIAELWPDSCQVTRSTRIPDGSGGFTQTWAGVGDPTPCRFGIANTSEAQAGQQVTATSTALVSFAKYTGVLSKDRVVVTIVETAEVVTVEVVGVGKSSDENWREIQGTVIRA